MKKMALGIVTALSQRRCESVTNPAHKPRDSGRSCPVHRGGITVKRIAASLAILCMASTPALAQNLIGDLPYQGIPAFTAPGTGLSVTIRGRALYDFADVDHSYPGPNQPAVVSDNDWRTLRIGADLSAGAMSATAEFEISTSGINPQDLNVSFRAADGVTITAGQFKEAFSMDNLTSGRFTTLMERGSVVGALGLSRRFGVRLAVNGSNWSWTTAMQGDPMNELRVSSRAMAASSRLTFAPVLDSSNQRFVHLGAAILHRKYDGMSRYRQRPMTARSDRVIDTGVFADSDIVAGLELAGGFGPFHFQSEYARVWADAAAGPAAGSTVNFDAAHLQVGWFVTGEHRRYRGDRGTFDRTSPRNQLGRGGFGALQLAARLDWADLNDGLVQGGKMTSWTIGASWFPTSRTRWAVEYTDASATSGAARNFGKGSSEVLQTRLQFDW